MEVRCERQVLVIKFVHCADIHLDSPFSAKGLGEGEKLRISAKNSFSTLIMEAKLFGAELLFIAGDLFEQDYVTKDTMLFIAGELERFGGRVFITPGNHDPFSKGSPYTIVKMPQNVTVFTQRDITFEDVQTQNGTVRIYGHAYDTPNPSYFPLDNFSVESSCGIAAHILVSHAVVDEALSPYACLTREQIRVAGFDYVALGHIHKHGGIGKVGKTTICYSGCLEGRNFGECGIKGAIFGEITQKSDGTCLVNCSFRRICRRCFEQASLDVSRFKTAVEFTNAVSSLCDKYDRDVNLKITLEGIMHPEVSLCASLEATSPLSRKARLCALEDNTTPYIDAEELEKDRGLRGEFYRRLKPKLIDSDPENRKLAYLALSFGLRAFDSSKKKK